MNKRPVKIDIVGERLKEILGSKVDSMSDAAELLGVSRQALHGWVRSETIPLPRLLTLSKVFSLTSEDIVSLKAHENVSVQFRAHRNKEVPDEIQDRVKQIAKDVVSHSKLLPSLHEKIQLQLESSSVGLVADQIRKLLEIPDHPITLEQVLASTSRLYLPVLFIPFDEELASLNVKGFAATCAKQDLIFLDSNLLLQDVSWNLLHELTHVVLGNTDGHSKEEEKFCNEVANEILTPSSFFRRSDVRSALKRATQSPDSTLIQLVEEISGYLGASFEGVVIAMLNAKILGPKSDASKYLWAVNRNRKARSVKVCDLITPDKKEDPVEFWLKALQDPYRSHFLQFHKLILNGLLSEGVSLARAAEVFEVDVMTMRDISLAKVNSSEEDATTH